ncbi:MAG: hypothetical protein KC800_10035 [Candidatus Eremiobacteraeota bacterium]|nr:hypothetical protein [Candidatus Eremiobacteraeota bacterium]
MRHLQIALGVLVLLTSIVGAEPIELTLTEERADPKFGLNRPMMARSADGTLMVAKRNSKEFVGKDEAMLRDRNGVLASQLMMALGLPCIPSREARWQTEDGWVRGTCTPWMEGALTLLEFPASRISNPDEAVAVLIWREFLGDGDINGTNLLVQVETGRLYAIDLDKAFQGVFPVKSSGFRDVMERYASPENVEPVLEEIRSMDSVRISALLDRVGPEALESWSAELKDKVLTGLLRNRAALLSGNPYARYYGRRSLPWFVPDEIQFVEGDERVRN